jgi:hypothetical protein
MDDGEDRITCTYCGDDAAANVLSRPGYGSLRSPARSSSGRGASRCLCFRIDHRRSKRTIALLEIDNHPNRASTTAVSGVCHYEYVTAWDSKRDPWYTGVLKVEGELYAGIYALAYGRWRPDKGRCIDQGDKIFLRRRAALGMSRVADSKAANATVAITWYTVDLPP